MYVCFGSDITKRIENKPCFENHHLSICFVLFYEENIILSSFDRVLR